MSSPPLGNNGHPDEHLFGLPALVPGRQLKQAWQQLDDTLEELEAKEHTITRLQEDLQKARQGMVAPPPVNTPSQVGILASDVAREHIHWLWPGRLALGKITLLDGDPGLGKSTLLFDLAARLTTGRPMPDDAPSEPGAVLILSTEDGLADTIRPRLEAAGADLRRCLVVQSIPQADGTTRTPLLPRDLPLLEQAARRVEARLMIVDPLMAHLDAETNTYRDQDVRRVLAEVSACAERCGLSVILVRHLNKSGGSNALYRGGGSIGIIGAARIGLLVGRNPEEEQRLVLACTKNNLAPMPPSLVFRVEPAPSDPTTSRIAWEGSTSLQARDLLVPSGGGSTAIDEAAAWLEEMLAEGPRPAAELYEKAAAVGFAKRVLQKARSRVAVTERLGGISGQGYWQWRLRRPRPSAKVPKVPFPQTGHLRNLRHLSDDGTAPEPECESRVATTGGHLSELKAGPTPESDLKMPKVPFPQTGHLRNLSENGMDPDDPEDAPPSPKLDSSGSAPAGRHLSASKAGRMPERSSKMPKVPFPQTGHLRHLSDYGGSTSTEAEETADHAHAPSMHNREEATGSSGVGSTKVPKVPSPNTGHLRDLRDLCTPGASHTPYPTRSSLDEAQPDSKVLRSGLRVKTPKGEGRILQVFAHRVTVHVGEQALSFPPDQLTVLPPPTPP